MIKIIVDSTCDLPKEYMERYDIKVLPLRVSINDVEYIDRVNIEIEEVYNAMRKGIIPKTSQVNPKDMYDLFTEICEEGNDFIYISFSSKLSGTNGLSRNVILDLKGEEKYKKRKMEVIDSKGGSIGTGLMALNAGILASRGYSYEEILESISDMSGCIEHIFSLTDLDWLIKGGRIGKAQGTVGKLLNVKPVLEMRNGEMHVIKKARGEAKTIKTLLDIVEERVGDFKEQLIGVAHADDLERAEKVKALLKERIGNDEIVIDKIGCVLGTHLGIGGVGILFFNKKPKNYLITEMLKGEK